MVVTNNLDGTLEKYIHEYANDPEFIAEGLAIKVTDEMLECLEQKGLSQSWLAEKMGVSRALISRILNAPPNMTLLTIAKIAVALGTTPDVCLNSEPWRLSTLSTIKNVPNAKDDKIWQIPINSMAGGPDYPHFIPSGIGGFNAA
jgi:plasmid maintenance system antidote protein VapI